MPLSSHLAPMFARLTYSGSRNPHHQIICLNPAGDPTPGVSPELLPTGGTPIDAGGALLLYVTQALAPQYPAAVRFGAVDLYSVDPDTGVRTFIFAYNMDTIGTNINPVIPFTESVFVFKSTVGKPIKVYCMESVYDSDQRNVGIVPADARQDMLDYVLSADNILYGQTNAYPLVFNTFTSKINDVLRRNGGFTDV
jgi:hypothetical protein